MKAYLYVEGAKLREVNHIKNEVWAMHMGFTFRARRLHFGSGASMLPTMAPDYVVPIEAEAVAVYVAADLVDNGGALSEHHRDAIVEQLKVLEKRSLRG
jgi:mono/diheme cytochrome c family protein